MRYIIWCQNKDQKFRVECAVVKGAKEWRPLFRFVQTQYIHEDQGESRVQEIQKTVICCEVVQNCESAEHLYGKNPFRTVELWVKSRDDSFVIADDTQGYRDLELMV